VERLDQTHAGRIRQKAAFAEQRLGTMLAVVDAFTRERIERSLGEEANKLRAEALVGAGKEVKFGEPKKVGALTCYEGTIDGKPVGTAFTVTATKGYMGPIEIVVKYADNTHPA
jgi:Na+-translocating ferredoxin:NAD+ oxidoreductase RnfG subunit